MSDELFYSDIEKNSKLLESITGMPVKSLSYPYGLYNDTLDKYLRNHGLVTFSSTEGIVTRNMSPIYRLNRPYDRNVGQIMYLKMK